MSYYFLPQNNTTYVLYLLMEKMSSSFVLLPKHCEKDVKQEHRILELSSFFQSLLYEQYLQGCHVVVTVFFTLSCPISTSLWIYEKTVVVVLHSHVPLRILTHFLLYLIRICRKLYAYIYFFPFSLGDIFTKC